MSINYPILKEHIATSLLGCQYFDNLDLSVLNITAEYAEEIIEIEAILYYRDGQQLLLRNMREIKLFKK